MGAKSNSHQILIGLKKEKEMLSLFAGFFSKALIDISRRQFYNQGTVSETLY